MFFSKNLIRINLKLIICFFSNEERCLKGPIYNSLNCGLGSNDNKKNMSLKTLKLSQKKLGVNYKNISNHADKTHSSKVFLYK